MALLGEAGFRVPEWFAVTPGEVNKEEIIKQATILAQGRHLLAVRSSAVDEDGAAHSFAGQYESYLGIHPHQVMEKVKAVWESGLVERVKAYKESRGLEATLTIPAVIVQRLIVPLASGVAFSSDPISGRRTVAVVSSVWGFGSALVSGEADADTFRINQTTGQIDTEVAEKKQARFLSSEAGEPVLGPVPSDQQSKPSLSPQQAQEVAALAQACADYFDRAQDIEWAIDETGLYLLQSRPITSLADIQDPDAPRLLWDNSNIVESYSGLTLPLTFSFARYVYEQVYTQFMRAAKTPEAIVASRRPMLSRMLGIVRGRVYYNLLSWYGALAVLPGFATNRKFMEQMMGVREELSAEAGSSVEANLKASPWLDRWRIIRAISALIKGHRTIERETARFQNHLDTTLKAGTNLKSMRLDQLAAEYRRLESQLLDRWDTPLMNDLLAMIFHGLLRSLSEKWLPNHPGLHNELLLNQGGMVSAEPVRRMKILAAAIGNDEQLTTLLRTGSNAQITQTLTTRPKIAEGFNDYLDVFGERCMDELKLESITLLDDPLPLYRAVGAMVGRILPDTPDQPNKSELAELTTPRRTLFKWVLKHARLRVRGRENLRLERTRVFGRVRRIFLECGKRLTEVQALKDPRDVFYLELDEVLAYSDGTLPCPNLAGLAQLRKDQYDQFAKDPAPPDRFETHGSPYYGLNHALNQILSPATTQSLETRKGLGCCPGVVKGRVKLVQDPQQATLAPGEILVAYHTDPGWVLLFPSASGLLVERGSLLSHSAIVPREIGLRAVVALPGLTNWLKTGDLVEFDGASGEVRLIEAAK